MRWDAKQYEKFDGEEKGVLLIPCFYHKLFVEWPPRGEGESGPPVRSDHTESILNERKRDGRPGTRLGVVWRFMMYGGLAAALVQIVVALGMSVMGWFEAGDVMQALGATETTLLIFGVGGLPIAMIVGVSYASWAGLCAAFIAFEARPAVKDRLGLMPKG